MVFESKINIRYSLETDIVSIRELASPPSQSAVIGSRQVGGWRSMTYCDPDKARLTADKFYSGKQLQNRMSIKTIL